MNIQEFTKALESQFVEADGLKLLPETPFRDNDFYDSLVGMSILVMIKDKFNYEMNIADFRACKTSQDLYNVIQNAIK